MGHCMFQKWKLNIIHNISQLLTVIIPKRIYSDTVPLPRMVNAMILAE